MSPIKKRQSAVKHEINQELVKVESTINDLLGVPKESPVEDKDLKTILEVNNSQDEDEKETEADKSKTQAQKDFEKKQAQDAEREEFGAGMEGDSTGRNQAFDAFNLVQSYFSDNYLDLDSTEDREMFKKWGLYNLKLLLDSYEEELAPQLSAPQIDNPA